MHRHNVQCWQQSVLVYNEFERFVSLTGDGFFQHSSLIGYFAPVTVGYFHYGTEIIHRFDERQHFTDLSNGRLNLLLSVPIFV